MQKKKDYKKILLERLQTDNDDSRMKKSKGGSSVKTQSTPTPHETNEPETNLSYLFTHFEQHFSVYNEPVRNFKPKNCRRKLFKELFELEKYGAAGKLYTDQDENQTFYKQKTDQNTFSQEENNSLQKRIDKIRK